MDNEPKTEPGASPPVTCTWCEATTNRQGDEFTQDSLAMHRLRCRKRLAPTVDSTVAITTVGSEPSFDGGKSIKSPSPTVADATTSLSLREKREAQPPSEAAAVQKEEESVAALWKKYGLDRVKVKDKDGYVIGSRAVFSPGDHYFMGVPYHLASKKVRAQRAGVIGKLRAYAHDVQSEEKDDAKINLKDKAAAALQNEKKEAERQRRIDNGEWWLALTKEEMTVHDAAFWTESARLLAELPEGEPVEPDEFSPFLKPKITHEDLAARVAEEFFARMKKKGKVNNDHRRSSRR